MLMAGKQVTQAGDQLTAVSLERVYKGIVNTDGPLAALVLQLRALRTMQPDAYRKAKTQLPYVVCAQFAPAVRRKTCFAYAEHFIIDIDHLSLQQLTPDGVKRLLMADERVALLFVSPGNDGVKAVFNLSQRVHDAGYYSVFYKTFAAKLAVQYQLHGLIDLVTHDVSRCCFMSHDPAAHYNPNATPVNPTEYLDPNSLEGLAQVEAEIKTAEKAAAVLHADTEPAQSQAQNLPSDVLTQIRQKLNPALAARPPKAKDYAQPQALDNAMPELKQALQDMGMMVDAVRPISYGKQLTVKAGNLWAEVNLFYGQHRFKAVATTKTGSSKPLAEMATQAIELHFEAKNNWNPP
ncbi:MAG: hypothetical protein EAY75_10125 [Bacteroidetes bacterium]|nr:MAG: hypothetical protein EAY75_10125 [Bacteroidota bacterium]